jgi:hypothetical protein
MRCLVCFLGLDVAARALAHGGDRDLHHASLLAHRASHRSFERAKSGFDVALEMDPDGTPPALGEHVEGFEVTPRTPSSSTSFFKLPLAMKPRARKSSQTD